jgi:hypothetical protein
MKISLPGALLLLLAAPALYAVTSTSTYGFVVSVDLKARTVTLRHHAGGSAEWKESTAAWDAKTEWSRAEQQDWDEKPATADLAKDLKKDTKVYFAFTDELPGGKLLLLKLKTLPPGMMVK